MLQTTNPQPALWEAIPPAELLALPTELARVDAHQGGCSARSSYGGRLMSLRVG